MRREELYLRDIVEASGHIAQFIAGLDRSGFHESELVRSAVVQKLAVIGEAAARVSDELKARYSDVALAVDSGLSQHPRACLFWDRLG